MERKLTEIFRSEKKRTTKRREQSVEPFQPVQKIKNPAETQYLVKREFRGNNIRNMNSGATFFRPAGAVETNNPNRALPGAWGLEPDEGSILDEFALVDDDKTRFLDSLVQSSREGKK